MNSVIDKYQSKIHEYFELIKFEHTIFALPFALSGMLLATPDSWPKLSTLIWVILAMVSGRTGAMALNRVIDAEIDTKNQRTVTRAIPAGRIKKASVYILTAISFIIMAFAVWQLPLICRQLFPVALAILVVYSYTKRFTHLTHLVLGSALGAAAVGGWLAVSGEITISVVFWGLSVVFWVAGFDIIYAIQDIEFDRKAKLFSVPAWLGVRKSLLLSKAFHVLTVFFLAVMTLFHEVGLFWWFGIIFVSIMLIYEHSLLSENNLSRINAAFFTVNGFISIGLFLFILIDKYILLKG